MYGDEQCEPRIRLLIGAVRSGSTLVVKYASSKNISTDDESSRLAVIGALRDNNCEFSKIIKVHKILA